LSVETGMSFAVDEKLRQMVMNRHGQAMEATTGNERRPMVAESVISSTIPLWVASVERLIIHQPKRPLLVYLIPDWELIPVNPTSSLHPAQSGFYSIAQRTMMSILELVGPAAKIVSTPGRLYGSLSSGRR